MSKMRYVVLQNKANVLFVEIPTEYAYQLSALHLRLGKEISKLTADNVPFLPQAIAECNDLEILNKELSSISSLHYINELESSFSAIKEENYPLISLLTEIRALQAQLEQYYEEEAIS